MSDNYLTQYRDPETKKFKTIKAREFLQTLNHYDKDNNGYLNGEELDQFIYELITSLSDEPVKEFNKNIIAQDQTMNQIKEDILMAFDENDDGKFDINELTKILPIEENFAVLFRHDRRIESSRDFLELWHKFDTDRKGYIQFDDLKLLMTDFYKNLNLNVPQQDIDDYSEIIMSICDKNGDDRIEIGELSKFLPVKQNPIRGPVIKKSENLTDVDFDRIFMKYDSDSNGYLERIELDAFIKDLLEALDLDCTQGILTNFKLTMLNAWSDSERIEKQKLKSIILQSCRITKEIAEEKH